MNRRMTDGIGKIMVCLYAYYFIGHSKELLVMTLCQCHTSAAAACGAADARAAQQADDGVDEAGQSVPHTSNNGDLPFIVFLYLFLPSDDFPVTRTILTLAVTLPLLYLPIFFLLL